jgi:hypothetical protein
MRRVVVVTSEFRSHGSDVKLLLHVDKRSVLSGVKSNVMLTASLGKEWERGSEGAANRLSALGFLLRPNLGQYGTSMEFPSLATR